METNIGYLLRMRRMSLNMTQEEASIKLTFYRMEKYKLSGISIAHSTISRMETEPGKFKFDDLSDYAEILGTSLTTILFVRDYSPSFETHQLMNLYLEEKKIDIKRIQIIVFKDYVNTNLNKFLNWSYGSRAFY